MSDTPQKTYLGDSVYAELESGMIKLYTDNGFGPQDVIYLEPEVYQALLKFVEMLNNSCPIANF